MAGATAGAGAVGAELEVVGFGAAWFVPVSFASEAVPGDLNILAAGLIPPLHPQPQSPRVIRRGTNKNNSDLLGLKRAGSDAW